ncbi:hypothetical protein QBC38DRAFT_446491 [Podospora fimiseda]|uniref:AA1-like domain-containing protein n=1 Tax=Podospora fimiseda TaxID=252190 RepID=A0AAN7GSH0_9PEZI|nr:hypothetical protein QBC38DRAFT_446491 [Podospora fimiseda]
MKYVVFTLSFLSFLSSTLGSPLSTRQVDCTAENTIPSAWVIDKLSVNYTDDETIRPGKASFTLTDNQRKTTENLRCDLRANYVCEFKGTPGDKDLGIWVQLNLGIASFTLNRTLVGCGEGGRNAYLIGQTELYLECKGEYIEEGEGLHCVDDGIEGVANGSVVLAVN